MNNDTLMLYYFNDGLSAAERDDVRTALESDPELAERYAALCRELDGWQDQPVPAAPPDLVGRLHETVSRAARLEHQAAGPENRSFSFASFAWGAAVTAALALGIGIGVYLPGSGEPSPVTTTAYMTPPQSGYAPAAFERGLRVHLRETGQSLARLPAETSADRTQLVAQIIQQNRLFERIAEQNDSDSVARVLRAFEPILLRLAADEIAPEDAEALREQLAFELKVMLTILERDASKQTESPVTETRT